MGGLQSTTLEAGAAENAPVYTHGLEDIYALENVDIRTVRPMSRPKAAEQEAPRFTPDEPAELQLDLGPAFRGWMPPIFLQESLRALKLSQMAQQTLERHSIQKIGDLTKRAPEDLVYLKGLGQGHIDEIQTKLKEYLGGRNRDRARLIDLHALVGSLLSDLNPKESVLLLEPYQLARLVTLTPAEEAELRHFSLEKREELRSEITQKLQEKRPFFLGQMALIIETFVQPWVERRLGLATEGEICERIQRLSAQPAGCSDLLGFLQGLFGDQRPFFSLFLPQLSEGLFAASEAYQEELEQLVSVALSYLFDKESEYHLDELVELVERELAREWRAVEPGQLESLLRHHPVFQVYRGSCMRLRVRLS